MNPKNTTSQRWQRNRRATLRRSRNQMMKAYKASDQQWVDWICKSDPEEEKKWAIRFFLLALVVFLFSVIGVSLGKYEFASGILGALPMFLMGVAKLNNFRLYRIIQGLAPESYQHQKNDLEPGDTDNPCNPPDNSKNQLDD